MNKITPRRGPKPVTMLIVKRAVCGYFKISEQMLVGGSRQKHLILPRHIAYFLGYILTRKSTATIGKEMGDRDHSSVLYGKNKIANKLAHDTELQNDLGHIEWAVEQLRIAPDEKPLRLAPTKTITKPAEPEKRKPAAKINHTPALPTKLDRQVSLRIKMRELLAKHPELSKAIRNADKLGEEIGIPKEQEEPADSA